MTDWPGADPAVLLMGPGIQRFTEGFYTGCPFERALGPFWITIEARASYATLERLFELLIAEPRNQVVIVNHASVEPVKGGAGKTGLLLPFAAGSTADATGPMIGTLGELAKRADSLTKDDPHVIDAASMMKVSPATALRLVGKLAQVRQKTRRWIHIRGCHLGEDQDLAREYKIALNAAVLTAVRCRMLYLYVAPSRYSMAELAALSAATPTDPKIRRRTFALPGMPDHMMVLDVQDIDGHTKVTAKGYIARPTEAAQFATVLQREWRDRAHPTQFYFEALWDNGESSYILQVDHAYQTHVIGV